MRAPKLSPRQREVLGIIKEFGSECWGDVFSHCDAWPGGALRFQLNFNRTCDSLVRRGLVTDNDGDIEMTALGRWALAESILPPSDVNAWREGGPNPRRG